MTNKERRRDEMALKSLLIKLYPQADNGDCNCHDCLVLAAGEYLNNLKNK